MRYCEFKAIRKGLGLSQSQLAGYLGVSTQLISCYERRTKRVSNPLSRIMWLLGDGLIKPADLIEVRPVHREPVFRSCRGSVSD